MISPISSPMPFIAVKNISRGIGGLVSFSKRIA
jgi:hypothetical protein